MILCCHPIWKAFRWLCSMQWEPGVCVLASDIPENREVVDGAGFTFHAGDVEDLERSLRFLIAESRVREAAEKAAQEAG